MDAVPAIEEIDTCRANGAKILISFGSIEGIVNNFLIKFLFKLPADQGQEIEQIILNSDWCTFSAKRKMLKHVLQTRDLVAGQRIGEIDKRLAEIMRYRNAFTHGGLQYDGETSSVNLSYFEGTPKSVTLDEVYWSSVERTFNAAFNEMSGLLKQEMPPISEKSARGGDR